MDKKDLLKQKKILFVDDDCATRDAFSMTLRFLAKEVLLARNGEEGLQMCLEFKPDFVITDLEMPIMNGIVMSEKIREIIPNQLIIVITAFEDETHLAKDVNAILIKPIDKNILKKTLYDLLD